MNATLGSLTDVVPVVLKALLLYVTAVVGFRVSHRRTLAEMTGFDFVAAVAVGAIVGRVPNASGTGYLAGAATLVTVLLAHALLTRLRLRPTMARLLDHPPRLLIADGRVLDDELRRSGITVADLYGLLRQHRVYDVKDVKFAIFEQRGTISVVRCDDVLGERAPILRSVTSRAVASRGAGRFDEHLPATARRPSP